LQAKAQFKRRSTANNVSIIIPVPDDADTPRFRTNIGTVHYAPETSSIVWKIKQFGGGKEFLMRAELGLPSVRGDDDKGGGMMGGFGGSMGGVTGSGKSKRPIQVKFEIPYFTTSGIQVRYLKIIEPKVRTLSSRPFFLSRMEIRAETGAGRNPFMQVQQCGSHICGHFADPYASCMIPWFWYLQLRGCTSTPPVGLAAPAAGRTCTIARRYEGRPMMALHYLHIKFFCISTCLTDPCVSSFNIRHYRG